MQIHSSLLAAAIAMLVVASPTSAAEPPVLQPSSAWVLDYADGHCRLARQFGGEGQKTVFYLEQYEPSSTFTVLVAGPPFASERLKKPSIHFGPDGGTVGFEHLRTTKMGVGSGVMATSASLLRGEGKIVTVSASARWKPELAELGGIVAPLKPESAAAITRFEMRDRDKPIAMLALGSMSQPVKALNTCTEELLAHWGIDLAQHRSRTKGVSPKTNPGTWIDSNDYPANLLAKGAEGIVFFRLNVDEKGKPTRCEIQQSTRPAGFDKVVCDTLMRNGRFSPALDGQGNPIPSYWRSTVNFRIPG